MFRKSNISQIQCTYFRAQQIKNLPQRMEQIKYRGDGIIVYIVTCEPVNYHGNSMIKPTNKILLVQLFLLEQQNSVLK